MHFSVEQMIGALEQAEVNVSVAGVIRKAGDKRTDVLPFECEVCLPGSGSGVSDGSVAGGEPASETACSGETSIARAP